MKNFTKKLALLLVFAMVLGVVAPGKVAKADAQTPSFEFIIDYREQSVKVKLGSTVQTEYDFAQYVPKSGTTAPTEEIIKAIKDKEWVTVDTETDNVSHKGDISWFNKKKDSFIVARVWDSTKNAYVYGASDLIKAREDAVKVLFSDKKEGAATTKTPAFTSAQAIGSDTTGYLVFYKGKTTFTVITPEAISFRIDGSYYYTGISENTFSGYLKRYMAKGTTLYFVQPKEDNSDNTGWAPAETKYKYAAQKNAPTVKLDITHVVPLKAGQEYRIVNASDKTKSAWVSVDTAHGKVENNKVKVGKILLEELVCTGGTITASFRTDEGKLDPAALATGNVKLQVRTAASTKGVASKIYSVVVTQEAIGTAASTASIEGKDDAVISVSYKKPYDATSGLVFKSNAPDKVDYEVAFLVSGASVTAANKWTTIKGTKSLEVKSLADSKTKEKYTHFVIRKVGDKKAGVLSSNYHKYAIADVDVTEQSITEATGAVTGITSSSAVVVSNGSVTITIPKAAASGAAIEEKSFDVTVEGVGNPGTLKWSSKGSNRAFTVPVPTYANNKVTFKFAVKKDTTTGDSGEYKCAVEGLNFTFKVVIGNN